MLGNINLKRGNIYFVAFFIASLPWGMRCEIISIAAFLLFRFINQLYFREKLSVNGFLLLSPLLLYALIYISGVFYGWEFKSFIKHFETRISLLLMPFLASTLTLKEKENKFIYKVFLISISIYFVYCLLNAFVKSINFSDGAVHFDTVVRQNGTWSINVVTSIKKNTNYFFGQYFAIWGHSSYVSVLVNTAIIILISGTVKLSWGKKAGVLIFFEVMLILLQARIGIVSSMIIYFYYSIKFFFKSKRLFIRVLPLVILFLFYLIITISPRFDKLIHFSSDRHFMDNLKQNTYRYDIWESSLEISKKNFIFGVGPQYVTKELQKKYEEKNLKYIYDKKYNCHNQYLQSLLSNGILGVLSVLSLLLGVLFLSCQSKNKEFAFIILMLLTLIFMFESVLERITGIHYLVTIYVLLRIQYTKEDEQ